jgi:hypothetical protein
MVGGAAGMDAGAVAVKCPQCSNNDQIRKVSVVVQEGTASRPSEFWTSGAFPTQYGPVTSRTDLAEELRLRRPPEAPVAGPIALRVVAGVIGIFVLAAILGTFMPVTVASWLSVLVGVAGIVFSISRAVGKKRISDEWTSRLPAMQTAWYDLYFCGRDGIIFRGSDSSKWGNARQSDMMNLVME